MCGCRNVMRGGRRRCWCRCSGGWESSPGLVGGRHHVRFAVVAVVGVLVVAVEATVVGPASLVVEVAKDAVSEAVCAVLVLVVTASVAAAVVDVIHVMAPEAVLVVDTEISSTRMPQ